MDHSSKLILVTGATGYVGGRLIPVLLKRGYNVRCLVRDPSRVEGRGWQGVEAVKGDVLKYEELPRAMKGVSVAYYLVHSMTAGEGFKERDIKAAENFGRAAKEAGVERIVYLGGLGIAGEELSLHLKSRQDTGDYLRKSGVPVTEFRAAQIIGSGSISFELIRYLAERLPVMPSPKWIDTKSQPISIRDVIRYLSDAIETPVSKGRIIEIGGANVLSYRDMILIYAKVRGLKRWMFKIPLMTTEVAAFFADLITPIPTHIVKPLIEGLKNEVIVYDNCAREIFDFIPMEYERAVSLALERIVAGKVDTTWTDAFSAFEDKAPGPVKIGNTEGLLSEKRQITAQASVDTAFKICMCFGGEKGWFYADYLWYLRGILDRLFGGVGLGRGRRCPTQLRVGDVLGFWRVEALKENKLLRLHAEMKMSSKAWLQFETTPIDEKHVLITQTAFFEPKGVLGVMYWYSLYPIHKILFNGMIETLAREAERGKL